MIIGVRVLFRNKYINNNKGYLIAANHQSTFDTIFFLNQFDKVIYVVKKELMYIPIYGWYAMRLGNIFIDRKERISAIKHLSYKVSAALKENYKIIIFPEGTRQEKNIIGNMKSGIYAIYKSCKCPIYPIYIGSYVVWPKNSYIKSKNDIKVKTLKPIRSNDTKINFLSRLKDDLEKEHIKKY